MLAFAAGVSAQNKWISVNARVSGSLITFSLYEKQADDSYLEIRAHTENNGISKFDSLAPGIYRVHMDIAYAKYLPTWHPEKAIWDEAADIDMTIADSFICNGGMLPNPALTGPGMISGELTEGLLKTAGEPLKNTRVVITDNNNAFVKMGRTNDSGSFSITNLPVGTYKIKVDIINASTANAKTVVLDSVNTSASVALTVSRGGTVTTGLQTASAAHVVAVYPNPVNDLLLVNGTGIYQLVISDMSGKQVVRSMISASNAADLSALPQGLYIAKLISGSSPAIIRKIVKQ